MTIDLNDPRRGLGRASPLAERAQHDARTRASKMAQVFPPMKDTVDDFAPPAQQRMKRAANTPPAPTSQQVEERNARFDDLPAEVKRRAAECGVFSDLELCEVTAHVYRRCLREGRNGCGVPFYGVDVAQALQLGSSKQADDLLEAAASAGLLRQERLMFNGGVYRPAF